MIVNAAGSQILASLGFDRSLRSLSQLGSVYCFKVILSPKARAMPWP